MKGEKKGNISGRQHTCHNRPLKYVADKERIHANDNIRDSRDPESNSIRGRRGTEAVVSRRRTMNREETHEGPSLIAELKIARTLHILKSRDVCAPFRYEIRPSRPDNPRPPRIYLDRVRRYFGIGLYCYRRPRKPV